MPPETVRLTADQTDLLALTQTLAACGREQAAIAPGTRFGHYRLLGELGSGGMGAVYLAEQTEPVRRKVAIKLSLQRRLSNEALGRFAIERQALAHMNHPAIAQVFDAGTLDDGTPYYVMEYVEGERLTDYCRSRGLGHEARVALLRRVCLGIAHAHRKGLIHCDLKPGNVLATEIDGQAQPKIIDFGIARALDGSSTEGSAGTPGYMSPEQAGSGADIDTRSDVYSLGLLLYELLADRPCRDLEHLSSLTLLQIRALIAAEAPPTLPPIPGLSAARRRELDAILARALARDPEARYPGAAELAEDLARWLARVPVEARQGGALYRLACFVRRQTLLSAAIVLFALVTLALLWQLVAQLAETRRERDTAEQITALLLDTFTAADPYQHPGGSISVRELLSNAAATLRGAALEPLLRVRVLEALGEVQSRLELYEDAASSYALAGELLGPVDPAQPRSVAIALAGIKATMNAGALDEASLRLNAVLPALRHRGPSSGLLAGLLLESELLAYVGRPEDALSSLAEAEPLLEAHGSGEDRHLLLRHRGRIAGELFRLIEAERDLVESVALAEALWGENDLRSVDALNDLALVIGNQPGRRAEALVHLREIAERTEQIWGGGSPGLAIALDNLAVNLQRHGGADALQEAEALSRRALAICQDTGHCQATTLAIIANNLANTLIALDQDDEARAALGYAVEMLDEILGPLHPHTALIRHNLARALLRAGELDRAGDALELSGRGLREAYGDSHPRLAVWRLTRAELLLERRQPDDAESELRLAEPVLRNAFGEDSEPLTRWVALRQRLAGSRP